MVRYADIKQEVDSCVAAAGRNPWDVKLVSVSKTVGIEEVRQAMEQGAMDFGENRPEMLAEKATACPDATWHFIGNIQSRQIDTIVRHASLIHSVYQLRHAQKIDACAREMGKIQDILIEVNVSGEQSKSGCLPEEAESIVQACCALENVSVRGLMTMAPQGDRILIEQTFEGLADLEDAVRTTLPASCQEAFCELSMGMSEDWKEAIPRGATMVRIGRAIFSDSFR